MAGSEDEEHIRPAGAYLACGAGFGRMSSGTVAGAAALRGAEPVSAATLAPLARERASAPRGACPLRAPRERCGRWPPARRQREG
eukprot:scaffold17854_cov124-Isochrysis_galbana.AAC.6